MKPWQAVLIMFLILVLLIAVGPTIAMVQGRWYL